MTSEKTDRSFVAFIVPNIYPCATGGMEIFYNNLIRELKKYCEVLLITVCKNYNEEGVKIVTVKKKLLNIPGSGRFTILFRVFFSLIKHRNKIKIIHFPYTSNAGKWGYLLPLTKKLFGLEYLIHIHAGGMGRWKFFSGNNALFKNAADIAAVSDITRDEYEKRANRSVKLIYPLVPFRISEIPKVELRKKYGYSSADQIILYIGSLKEIKSPETLLNAFNDFPKNELSKLKLKLIFVGTGVLESQLRKKTNDLGLHEFVTFAGLVPYEDVPNYFKMADIYVMPSKFEGTPKSLLEAMFNMLPIIASDVEGINNVLTDNENALLFQVGNSKMLKSKIEMLLSDKNLANRLAENAHKLYHQKYSFDRTMAELKSIYQLST